MSKGEDRISDEALSAYLDGEADADAVVRIETALATDAILAERLARLDAQDQRVRFAFDEVLDGAAEARLAEIVRSASSHSPSQPPPEGLINAARAAWRRPVQLGWAAALQAMVLLVGVGLIAPLAAPEKAVPSAQPAYRVLSSQATPATGDILVVFTPEATAKQIAMAVRRANARLVGGPTPADAWLLDAPAGHEAEALNSLRADKQVAMAEPLAPGADQ